MDLARGRRRAALALCRVAGGRRAARRLRATSGEVELEFEVAGPARAPAILLVAGLGGQLTSWDDEFCCRLVGEGFQVIRFDNRDAGLSSKLDDAGTPDLLGLLVGTAAAPYPLDAMADDAEAVIAAAGAPAVHVVGLSMGGMIGQLLAVRHPQRVLSLTSLLSGPAGRPRSLPASEVVEVLLRPPAFDRRGQIAAAVELRRVLAAAERFDVEAAAARAAAQVDRAHHPAGTLRQAAAVLAAGDRRQEIAALRLPALVAHGDRDPLVPLDAGRELAGLLPGARLLVLEGVGHDLPPAAAERVLEAFLDLLRHPHGIP